MTLVAAASAYLAVLLGRPSGRWWVRRRLGRGGGAVPGGWVAGLGVLAGVGAVTRVPAVSPPRIVLAATVAAVAVFVARQVRAARDRARVMRRRGEIVELLVLMAAELRAGVLPGRMVTGLADDFPMLLPAARAAELGGDVVAALHEAAQVPGHELLRDLGGAWHVADRSGAPLADVLARLAQAARIERDIAREAEAGVAPARATGRLMAVLPVVGLLLGTGMGGSPVGVLTGTWIGVSCLAAGCALACLGMAWIERIAASAVDA
ncbi:MAG: type II secretion system protein [Aeromicrobium sp.]